MKKIPFFKYEFFKRNILIYFLFLCSSFFVSIYTYANLNNSYSTKSLNASLNASLASKSKVSIDGFADIVEPLVPAVVNIYTTSTPKKKSNQLRERNIDPFFREFFQNSPFLFDDFYQDIDRSRTSLGSGFVIDSDGYIVTNHHVIDGADKIKVKMEDNIEFEAELIGSDKRTDIALLKINTKNKLHYVKFGNSAKGRVGDWIIAIGNPLGFGRSVTCGIISYNGRDLALDNSGIVDNFIQTDAAINSGNSGGPMFNIEGEVIGVNTAIASPDGRASVGLGFAIPSTTVISVIDQLKMHGKVERGLLNIKIQDVTEEIAEALGLENSFGAFVAEVQSDGAGAKAGIKAGDVIIEFNNQQVKNVRKLQIAVAEFPLNKEFVIKIIRGGKKEELKSKILSENIINKSSNSISKNGITFSDISPELCSKFKLDNSKGIVVSDLERGEKWSALKIGDVILGVNQQPIENILDFEKLYNISKKNNKKNIIFLIKRQNMTVFIALPM